MNRVCWMIVMAWPHPLPDVRKNRLFGLLLERSGEYCNKKGAV